MMMDDAFLKEIPDPFTRLPSQILLPTTPTRPIPVDAPPATAPSESQVDNELPTVKDGGQVREIKQGEKISMRDKIKMGRSGETSWVITMLFSNGTCRQFVISTTQELFKYRKRWYHLRYENSWFDLSFKYYRLFFFDDYVEPLDTEIIRKGNDSWWSVTPDNVKGFTRQQHIKNITESEITRWLKIITVIAGLGLIVSFGMVAYFLLKGGVPGLGGFGG